ncbi:hypothetical protein NLJ89_g10909 [Agrocybe chaxingu]|uniref:Beta-glucuronidase C-terminal domain-containing protein n=1 Tax=Agrocybe chaxingu TaxID=84603 RepID=A0A9W8JTD9_9AGAR|nr:hypothetical protein NLJ89_g10909 [Agrocybe chaxingu]
MSVINQVMGKNSSFIQVPFLNLMANIEERAGSVLIRLGGNTQEYATMVDELPNGNALAKEDSGTKATTETPAVLYTKDLFYIAGNISTMVNVKWFVGIPFNDSANWRLAIAENAQEVLGDNLLAMQAGNEPDLYARHEKRPSGYTFYDYFGEVGDLIQHIDANDRIPVKNNLLAPSLATGDWFPEDIWNIGFLEAYIDRLWAITMEHYPTNNCFAQFGVGSPQDPQANFPNFLTHTAGIDLIQIYLNTSRIAAEAGKPFIMFETNTASCGGFPGISDSYGAALWALDYGMQMAYSNFTYAMLHVGGQNVYYNPFTAPPTNQTAFNQWTIGAVYYSTLIMAELFGKSNTSRIVDLWGNAGNVYTPSYAVYENDVLSKVALFNYVDDPTGGSDLTVGISVPGAGVPNTIRVKYLEASSVSVKTNITWAGQTFGNKYEVDGRLRGELNVTTIQCDRTANVCQVPVKAPGFALVFMEDDEAISIGQATQTFATTARTRSHNTATVDQQVLATSNGHSGKDRALNGIGSTSVGSVSAATRLRLLRGVLTVVVGMVGAFVLLIMR